MVHNIKGRIESRVKRTTDSDFNRFNNLKVSLRKEKQRRVGKSTRFNLPKDKFTQVKSVDPTHERSKAITFTRTHIPENFSPDINDALRPEPLGMFKAIAEQNKLSGGLFEDARTKVNESFKEPREKQSKNIAIAQKTLPTFSDIIKRLFGVI